MAKQEEPRDPVETLGISIDTLAYIALKAHAFDAEVEETDPDEGSDAVDDNAVSVLEDQPDNPTEEELREAIEDLSDEEQAALVAIVWIGRNDFEAAEWEEAVQTAQDRRKGPTADYLVGMPLLGDYIENGADAMGFSLASTETQDLYGAKSKLGEDRED